MATIALDQHGGRWRAVSLLLPFGDTESSEQIFDTGDVIADWLSAISHVTSFFCSHRVADMRCTFITESFDEHNLRSRYSKRYIIPTESGWEIVSSKPVTGTFFPVYVLRAECWDYSDLQRYARNHMRKQVTKLIGSNQ